MDFESSSAGPSTSYAEEPCTLSMLPQVSAVLSETSITESNVSCQLHPSRSAALNDNVRTLIYNRTDPHIQLDMRAFYNCMEYEEALQPNYHYFTGVQENITPFHREQAIDWIYDVAKEENCDGDVFLLAVSLIDRFMSVQNILKHDIQMIAGVALFIASKLKAPHPMTASKIAYYSDNSCPIDMILQWELLIVTTLQWETESPTAFSFFNFLASRIPQIHNTRGDFQTVVQKCQKMHKLATLFPSMQCAIGLYYVSNLPTQNKELAVKIKDLLANMFQLEVNLLDSYIPMVQRCMSTTPIYTSEDAEKTEPTPSAPASTQEPEAFQELKELKEEPLPTPPPEEPAFQKLVLLEPIPLSEQTPSTPLNDSGFSSDVSSPASSEKKRRRSTDWFEEDSTPPKIFKTL
nr:cyclin D [Caenorhabditis elegans]